MKKLRTYACAAGCTAAAAVLLLAAGMMLNAGCVNRPASEAGATGPAEILPPRLPLQRIKQTVFVDLSKVANRGLTDVLVVPWLK